MMGGGDGGPGLAWIWPAMLILGVGAMIWGLMRARMSGRVGDPTRHARSDNTSQDSARDILRGRFARGEITEDELRQRLKVLDDR